MSKYIDLKLALNKLWRLCEEDIDAEKPEAFDFGRAEGALQSLPTIEVSEDCISREYILSQAFASNEYNRETKWKGEE